MVRICTRGPRAALFALVAASLAGAVHAAGSADLEWLDCAPGSGSGAPVLSAQGALRAGGSVVVSVNAGPGQFCALFVGTDAALPGVPVAGGELVVSGAVSGYKLPLDLAGDTVVSFPVTLVPRSAYLQVVTVDGAGTFRLSNTIGANRGHQWIADTRSVSWSSRTGHGAAVLGNAMYLIGGRSLTSPSSLNDVHRFDGQKWTRLLASDAGAQNRFSPRDEAGVVAHAGRLWVGFGSASGQDLSDLWSSANGTSWTRETANASAQGGPGPRNNLEMASFAGKLWVVGGFHKASPTQKPTQLFLNEVWSYDTSQKTWVRRVAPWQGREEHTLVVHAGRMYVVGGRSVVDDSVPYNYIQFSDVWSTGDGVNWRLETQDAGFLPMMEHATVSFEGALRLFGGFLNTYNYQWRSADGANWSVPLELGGPGYNFGNKPIASAAKDAMPDIVRYDSVGLVFQNRVWSLGGYGVNTPYNAVLYSD